MTTLLEDGKTYCFDVKEVSELGGLNPFTRKPLPEVFVRDAATRAKGVGDDIHEEKQSTFKNPLRNQVLDLLNKAEEAVPYFPRRRFGMLNLRRLKEVALELNKYDPQFDLSGFERGLIRIGNNIGNKILSAKKHILTRLLRQPGSLGIVLRDMISPRH